MFWSTIPAMIAAQSASAAQQAANHQKNRRQYESHRAAGLNSMNRLLNLMPKPCEYCRHPGHSKLCTQCGAPRDMAAK